MKSWRRPFSVLATVCLCATLGSCARASVAGARDPAFTSTGYNTVLVAALNVSFNAQIEVEDGVCRRLRAKCYRAGQEFPPTRSWTKEDVEATVSQKGIDSVLVLTRVSDASESAVVGYQTFASATTTAIASAYGNSARVSATTTGTATTVPIIVSQREADVTIRLVDAKSGEMAYFGNLVLSGYGRFGTSDSSFIKSAIKGILNEIKKQHLFTDSSAP